MVSTGTIKASANNQTNTLLSSVVGRDDILIKTNKGSFFEAHHLARLLI